MQEPSRNQGITETRQEPRVPVPAIVRSFIAAILIALLLAITLLVLAFYAIEDDGFWSFLLRELGAGLAVSAVLLVVLQLFFYDTADALRRGFFDWLQERVMGKLTDVHSDLEQTTEDLKTTITDASGDITSAVDTFLATGVRAGFDDLRERLEQQTDLLYDSSASLVALQEAGVSRLFASRSEANDLIRDALTADDVTDIRLLGISLNDFVTDDANQALHAAWRHLAELIQGERTRTTDLRIRVLAIDPTCRGAELRSEGELRAGAQNAGRLTSDVKATAEYLTQIVPATAPRPVDFAFRLYHLPPTLFVCVTDKVAFFHPYYFWAARDSSVPIPLMSCKEGSSLYRGLQEHFDLIWNEASVSPTDFVAERESGIDRGAADCNLLSIITDTGLGARRIERLLDESARRPGGQAFLRLSGFSLHSFFAAGGELNEAILGFLHDSDGSVRVLIPDLDSPPAHYRSYREWMLRAEHAGDSVLSFDEYCDNPDLHRASALWVDTMRSEAEALRLMELYAGRFEARKTALGPACFLLLTNLGAFVEQYHYGHVERGDETLPGERPILGKDVPVLEYEVKPAGAAGRSPYSLLQSHFDFTWNYCSEPLGSRLESSPP